MKVAIVSSLEHCNKISEDKGLKSALQKYGIESDIVAWESKDTEWTIYDAAILRSAWGYHKKYDEFIQWMDHLDTCGVRLINSTNMVRWNIHKDLQLDTLRTLGIPVIPYSITNSADINIAILKKQFNTNKIVLKPTVSASGTDTYILGDSLSRNTIVPADIATIFKNRQIIAQPYLENIIYGEYALVYIGGQFSHAVIRFPGIFAQKQSSVYIEKLTVPAKILGLAENCARKMNQHFGSTPAYARYDIVDGIIMEVELAEPDLMTRNIPEENSLKALSNLAQIVHKEAVR